MLPPPALAPPAPPPPVQLPSSPPPSSRSPLSPPPASPPPPASLISAGGGQLLTPQQEATIAAFDVVADDLAVVNQQLQELLAQLPTSSSLANGTLEVNQGMLLLLIRQQDVGNTTAQINLGDSATVSIANGAAPILN
eukprot:3399696-Prymnesium_polylepis.1